MASNRRMQAARQQELRFLSRRRISGGEDGDQKCREIDEDEGSIARSSIDLSHEELRRDDEEVAFVGCFSSSGLKRSLKALCGRLGKWTSLHAPKKPSGYLYRYLHISHFPLQLQLDHPPHQPISFFHRQQSRSRQSLLAHPVNIGFKEHLQASYTASPHHELDVKDIHLDPQFFKDDNISSKGQLRQAPPAPLARSAALRSEDTKPQNQHPLHPRRPAVGHHDDHQLSPSHKISSINGYVDASSAHLPNLETNKPSSLTQNFEQHDVQLDPKCQINVLTSFHKPVGGIDHQYPQAAINLLPTTNYGTLSAPSRSLIQAKPLVAPKPLLTLCTQENGGKAIRSTLEADCLSTMAAHVFSLRSQVIKGGFGGVHDPLLQETRDQAARKHCINLNTKSGNGDAKDVKKTIASLISTRKYEDLADLEEFLQCYMSLYTPSFLNMVDEFFCDICNDIFECEALFDT